MVVAMALSIVGSLDIFEGHPKPNSYSCWKAGSALIVLVWLLLILWTIYSFASSQEKAQNVAYRGSTTVSTSTR